MGRSLLSEDQSSVEDNSWSANTTIAASKKSGREEGGQNLFLKVFEVSRFGQRETESYWDFWRIPPKGITIKSCSLDQGFLCGMNWRCRTCRKR